MSSKLLLFTALVTCAYGIQIHINVLNQSNPVVIPNTTVNIVCEVSGINDSTSTFFWSGPVNARYTLCSTNNTSSVIEITPTLESSYGTYTCFVKCLAGKLQANISINYFPQIWRKPQDKFAIYKENNATFLCETYAVIELTVTWLHTNYSGYNNTITPDNDHYKITETISNINHTNIRFSQLEIIYPSYSDHGIYTCVTNNSFGKDSAEANLTIQVVPTFVGDKIVSPNNTFLNNPASFHCEAEGYPIPTISWHHNGAILNESNSSDYCIFTIIPANFEIKQANFADTDCNQTISDVFEMHNHYSSIAYSTDIKTIVSVLFFPEVKRQYTGNYSCDATNGFPQKKYRTVTSETVTFYVLDVPDPPYNVTLLDSEPNSLSLKWIVGFNGNSKLLSFNVYYKNIITNDSFEEIKNVSLDYQYVNGDEYNTTIHNVENILPSMSYTAQIEACNYFGCSNKSKPSNELTTKQDSTILIISLPVASTLFIGVILTFLIALCCCHKKVCRIRNGGNQVGGGAIDRRDYEPIGGEPRAGDNNEFVAEEAPAGDGNENNEPAGEEVPAGDNNENNEPVGKEVPAGDNNENNEPVGKEVPAGDNNENNEPVGKEVPAGDNNENNERVGEEVPAGDNNENNEPVSEGAPGRDSNELVSNASREANERQPLVTKSTKGGASVQAEENMHSKVTKNFPIKNTKQGFVSDNKYKSC